jgi:hypothetical protein
MANIKKSKSTATFFSLAKGKLAPVTTTSSTEDKKAYFYSFFDDPPYADKLQNDSKCKFCVDVHFTLALYVEHYLTFMCSLPSSLPAFANTTEQHQSTIHVFLQH